MRLTTKGQVTIPQAIRDRLGLLPHTEVEFEIDGDAVRIRPARRSTSRGDALIARMRGTATGRLSTDQIMALTRR
jgi:AbrB family looped-hinge helix DNA binding protein